MSSANEHFPPPPPLKPRMSPLDFRNTDLVSRLLAATPPYLYNMSLLPNTFFFSEMLRSFVQAKAEHNRAPVPGVHRRSRKRTWTSTRADLFQKPEPSPKQAEKPEPPNDWMLKSNNAEKKEEIPLELTMNKYETNREPEPRENKSMLYPKLDTFSGKPELPLPENMFPLHPIANQDSNPSSNLVLPPPPPMWYPPLYPAPPYGIDPLHFFIDLRVSGHIYDRKNQKDSPNSPSSTIVSPLSKEKTQQDVPEAKVEDRKSPKDFFRQSRHASAFSVPSSSKGSPINLSHPNPPSEKQQTKFDVKSMGFDKNSNKTSTNYIMNNIKSIYGNVYASKHDNVTYDETVVKHDIKSPSASDEDSNDRHKKNKDLKSIFGLDFVVDYMNNTKSVHNSSSAESVNSTDFESIGSPALEVVAVNDES